MLGPEAMHPISSRGSCTVLDRLQIQSARFEQLYWRETCVKLLLERPPLSTLFRQAGSILAVDFAVKTPAQRMREDGINLIWAGSELIDETRIGKKAHHSCSSVMFTVILLTRNYDVVLEMGVQRENSQDGVKDRKVMYSWMIQWKMYLLPRFAALSSVSWLDLLSRNIKRTAVCIGCGSSGSTLPPGRAVCEGCRLNC